MTISQTTPTQQTGKRRITKTIASMIGALNQISAFKSSSLDFKLNLPFWHVTVVVPRFQESVSHLGSTRLSQLRFLEHSVERFLRSMVELLLQMDVGEMEFRSNTLSSIIHKGTIDTSVCHPPY
jgi:hypothetical protein